jgi:hypothetical protein
MPGKTRRTYARLLILTLLAASTTSCSVFKVAGSLAGNRAGVAAANAFPTKAKTVVNPRGGPFCDVMRERGWPLRSSDADKTHLKALSRPTLEPIIGAQSSVLKCPGVAK